MKYYNKDSVEKLKLEVPQQHNFLSYVSSTLDIITFHDDVELFKKELEKYPHVPPITILRACIEQGASSCFTHFFENTKSPKYFLEELFKKPEMLTLGPQCAYFYVKNNKILKTIDEVCEKEFPGKAAIDLLTDTEQIEYCAARFGIQGRIKRATQLLDKLKTPLFMVHKMHVFEYAYGNEAQDFCKVYLEKIEEQKLVEPFMLSLFSAQADRSNKIHLNFFDRFTTKCKISNSTSKIVNDFLIKNLKNNTISVPFQELMMAYCVRNGSAENFKLYYNARPITKHNVFSMIKEPWKFMPVLLDPDGYRLCMTNNALKVFQNEAYSHQWMTTLKELNVLEMQSSISSLFCLGKGTKLENYKEWSLEHITSNYTDWETQDSNGNNFTHYLAYFYTNPKKEFQNLRAIKDTLATLVFLANNYPEALTTKNKEGKMAVNIFLKEINQAEPWYIRDHKADLEKINKLLEYAALKEQLNISPASATAKKMKI